MSPVLFLLSGIAPQFANFTCYSFQGTWHVQVFSQVKRMQSWVISARERLLELRDSEPGWGYRIGGEPATEPTVLAALGLFASDEQSSLDLVARNAARWLKSIQRPDGAVGISFKLQTPEWPTSYALLLWQAVGAAADQVTRGCHWLLQHKGMTFPNPKDGVLGHDTTIPGWSWVNETYSWLEPTAMAVIVLRRAGFADHPRVRLGIAMIHDRVIPEGGWNFGNNVTFGTSLRPKPAPTGMALIALADGSDPTPAIEKSLDYLSRELVKVRSAESLGWGLLGLAAWGRLPADAASWLEESSKRVIPRPDAAMQLGCLLMASSSRTLECFGVSRPKGAIHASRS